MGKHEEMTPNEIAMEHARDDAMMYGAGWIRSDCYGNLTRIDPTRIRILFTSENDDLCQKT